MEQTQDKPRRGRKPAAKTVEKATEKKVAPKPKRRAFVEKVQFMRLVSLPQLLAKPLSC